MKKYYIFSILLIISIGVFHSYFNDSMQENGEPEVNNNLTDAQIIENGVDQFSSETLYSKQSEDIFDSNKLESFIKNCIDEYLVIMNSPDCGSEVDGFAEIAATTNEFEEMISALSVIHTEIDVYTLETLIRDFMDRSDVSDEEIYLLWDQAFSGTTDTHGLHLFYQAYLASDKVVQEKYLVNVTSVTYLNLGTDQTNLIAKEYANKIIDSVEIGENGAPVGMSLTNYLTLHAGINNDFDYVNYIHNYLTERNDPRLIVNLFEEFEGQQRDRDLDRLLSSNELVNILQSSQSNYMYTELERDKFTQYVEMFHSTI